MLDDPNCLKNISSVPLIPKILVLVLYYYFAMVSETKRFFKITRDIFAGMPDRCEQFSAIPIHDILCL